MKKIIIGIFIALLICATGCTDQQPNKDPWQIDMQSGIGGLNSKPEIQEYNYKFAVSHSEKQTFEDVIV